MYCKFNNNGIYMAEEELNKITVVYEKSKNHSTLPVTGAYGGLSPDGHTVITNLFIEQVTIPNYVTLNVKDKVVDTQNEERVARGNYTREVLTTLMIAPEVAITLGEWLIARGNEALEFKNRK